MKDDVKRILKRCDNCLHSKAQNHKQEHTLTPIVSTKPLERVQLDYTFLPTGAGGRKCILIAVDHFSKYMWCKICSSKESKHVVDLLNEIKDEIGAAKISIIHTDNGGEFCANDVEECITKMGAQHVCGAPYHPQSQGCVERLNGTFKLILFNLWRSNGGSWVEHVSRAREIYLKTHHDTLNSTPNEVWETCILNPAKRQDVATSVQAIRFGLQREQEIIERQEKRSASAVKRKTKRNKSKEPPLAANDYVLVKVPEKWRKEGEQLYHHEAMIVDRLANNTCKIRWVKEGIKHEKAGQISQHCFRVGDLKRYTPAPEDLFVNEEHKTEVRKLKKRKRTSDSEDSAAKKQKQ